MIICDKNRCTLRCTFESNHSVIFQDIQKTLYCTAIHAPTLCQFYRARNKRSSHYCCGFSVIQNLFVLVICQKQHIDPCKSVLRLLEIPNEILPNFAIQLYPVGISHGITSLLFGAGRSLPHSLHHSSSGSSKNPANVSSTGISSASLITSSSSSSVLPSVVVEASVAAVCSA